MAIGSEFKSSGITERTPKTVMLGAGTIHKGLTFTAGSEGKEGAWNFQESLICATSGGSKLSIVPEFYDVPVDGALVKVKGLTVKVGETATLEINPIEMKPEILNMAVIGDEKESTTAKGYMEMTSRAIINEGDYVEKLGYVGKTIEGKPVIIVFDHALCTSGLELEGKNKEAAVPKFTFECFADLSPEADTLPWHIYYPKETAATTTTTTT